MALVRARAVGAGLLAALVASRGLRAEPLLAPPTEYEVKAAFLYNFGKFVDWPAEARASREGVFVVAVLGPDPFGPVLERTLRGKMLDGRRVVIERWSRVGTMREAHIVFVGAPEAGVLEALLPRAASWHALVVGESPTFLESGGMVEFWLDHNKVRFDVNLAAVEASGLQISSQLLKLAQVVQPAGN